MAATMKFPPEYKLKVDMKKVAFQVIKPWITQKITGLLGFEDEVVIEMVFNMLEAKKEVDPKTIQIDLTGFLNKHAQPFVKELWMMLASASQNEHGIPDVMLQEKEKELAANKEKTLQLQNDVQNKLDRQRLQRMSEMSSIKIENSLKDAQERARAAASVNSGGSSRKSRFSDAPQTDNSSSGETRDAKKKPRSRSRSKERRDRSRRHRSRSRSRSRGRARRKSDNRERTRDRRERNRRDRSRERKSRRNRSRSNSPRRKSKKRSKSGSRSRSRGRNANNRSDSKSARNPSQGSPRDTTSAGDTETNPDATKIADESRLREIALKSVKAGQGN